MTDALADFLSWFDGFSENIETAPNEKQWARVKERIAKIRTAPVADVRAPTGVHGIPNPPPAADPALLEKLAKMKQAGKTAAAPGGQAMSAGV